MNRKMLFLALGALAAVVCAPAASMANDRWEFNFGSCCGNDDGPWQSGLTDNEMTPGSIQEHDMEGAGTDEDWIILSQRPFSSYEVRVDGMSDGLTFTTGTGDILAVDLVESDGTVVATGYNMNPAAVDRRVTFANDTATANDDRHMRISSPFCAPCGAAESVYTIRMFDTTYNVPRFNNSASQVTVLILQNSVSASVSYTAHFFDPSGTLLASSPGSISGHGTAVINTSAIPGLAGQGGSAVVTSTGGYAALSGKAVALEPGTGFTFDTMMTPRPQ